MHKKRAEERPQKSLLPLLLLPPPTRVNIFVILPWKRTRSLGTFTRPEVVGNGANGKRSKANCCCGDTTSSPFPALQQHKTSSSLGRGICEAT